MNKVHQYKGYDIRRGSYYGTTDDRADRWYIDDPDSKTLDRRGAVAAPKSLQVSDDKGG